MKNNLSYLFYATSGDGRLFAGRPLYTGPAATDESRLIQQVLSANPTDRICAVRSLDALSGSHYFCFIVRLLKDQDATVRQAALNAIGFNDYLSLWQEMTEAVGAIESRRIAAAILVAFGADVIPVVEQHFAGADKPTRLRLIRVLERIGGVHALKVLTSDLQQPDEEIRTAVVQALAGQRYRADEALIPVIERQTGIETDHAARLLAALADLNTAPHTASAVLHPLQDVLNTQLSRSRSRLKGYLTLLPAEHQIRLRNAAPAATQSGLGLTGRLIDMLEPSRTIIDHWLLVCTVYTIIQLELSDSRIIPALFAVRSEAAGDRLIQETVNVALTRLQPEQPRLQSVPPATATSLHHHYEYKPMFSTIEKVLFLKGVNLFYETPDAILIELASLLEEIDLGAGRTLFEKGTTADGMYIIVAGRVKIHDGELILNYQGRGEVFGELALLDEQPRLASVTALEDTRLLKLDQEGFYLLMEDHIEFVRGVLRVLSGYLRGNLRNITDLDFNHPVKPERGSD
jgi:hypothetical protein